jgi:hypothetical protein
LIQIKRNAARSAKTARSAGAGVAAPPAHRPEIAWSRETTRPDGGIHTMPDEI